MFLTSNFEIKKLKPKNLKNFSFDFVSKSPTSWLMQIDNCQSEKSLLNMLAILFTNLAHIDRVWLKIEQFYYIISIYHTVWEYFNLGFSTIMNPILDRIQ